MTTTATNKPIPQPTEISRAYWDALAQEKVLVQECQSCGHRFFFSRRHCPQCWSDRWIHSEARGPFKLHTFTVSRVPTLPEFFDEMPQCLAVVELEAGVRANTALKGISPEGLSVGMELRPLFVRRGDRTLLYFTVSGTELPSLVVEGAEHPDQEVPSQDEDEAVAQSERTPIHFKDIPALEALISGGFTDWSNAVIVDQELVNTFAQLSGDHYWIHTDPERARNESPFGGTIAHGALVQVLISRMRIPFRHEVVGFQSMVNYGSNKLRFPSPVPVGSQVHAKARVTAVESLAKGTQVTIEMQTFVRGFDRPSVINEIVVLYMG